MIKKRASDGLGDESGPGWRQLLIFPEGTTTNGRSLIKFKTGAFEVNKISNSSLSSITYNNRIPEWGNITVFVSSLVCRSRWFWSDRWTITIPTQSRGLGTRPSTIPWCSSGWPCVNSTQISRYINNNCYNLKHAQLRTPDSQLSFPDTLHP